MHSIREGNAVYGLEKHGKAKANPFQLTLLYGAGKTAVWRVAKKVLDGGGKRAKGK